MLEASRCTEQVGSQQVHRQVGSQQMHRAGGEASRCTGQVASQQVHRAGAASGPGAGAASRAAPWGRLEEAARKHRGGVAGPFLRRRSARFSAHVPSGGTTFPSAPFTDDHHVLLGWFPRVWCPPSPRKPCGILLRCTCDHYSRPWVPLTRPLQSPHTRLLPGTPPYRSTLMSILAGGTLPPGVHQSLRPHSVLPGGLRRTLQLSASSATSSPGE